MLLLSTQRRLTGWIAVFAILLAALVPALSHALGSGKAAAAWIEVCSAEGSKWVASDSGKPAGPPGSAHSLAHCPGCLTQVPTMGLPPADVAVLLPPGLKHERPPAFLAASTTPHAWINAQPRAPPPAS